MKKALYFLCAISLLANVALALRFLRPGLARSPAASPVPPAIPAPKTPPALAASLLEAGDAAAIREALQRAGADERTIRAVLEGVLRSRYQDALAAERVVRWRQAWWKTRVGASAEDAKRLREGVTEPALRLLGPDPLDLLDAENRYAFLPAEKRRKLAQIDQDYRAMRAQLQFPPGTASTQTRAEQEQVQLLANERRKDVLAELTSEEKAELELRFSDTAHSVIARMDNIAATEAEYRAVKAALDELDQRTKALPPGEENGGSDPAADLKRETVRQLVEKFGYDRAVDIVWAGYNEYAAIARASRATQLPASTVGQVMTLSAETGLQAATIHRDGALTLEEKRAALAALEQSARSRLHALLPGRTQQMLEPSTFAWLTELGQGKYRVMSPGLKGYNGFMPLSLNQPAPPAKVMEIPFMPVRPPGR